VGAAAGHTNNAAASQADGLMAVVKSCLGEGGEVKSKHRPNARPMPQQPPHKHHGHKQRETDGRRKERSMAEGQL